MADFARDTPTKEVSTGNVNSSLAAEFVDCKAEYVLRKLTESKIARPVLFVDKDLRQSCPPLVS